jgi:hypothetical protein
MNQVRLVTTVKEFREQYSLKQGQDPEFSRLIYSGKELRDVNDCGECAQCSTHSVLMGEIIADSVCFVRGGDDVEGLLRAKCKISGLRYQQRHFSFC